MANDPDAVSVLIDGTEFQLWSEITIERAIDQYSTISLTSPFEPDRLDFREALRPFSFHPFNTLIGGTKLFTGTLLDPVPEVDPVSTTVSVTAYAKPAVLHDCSFPSTSLKNQPLEFKKVGLRAITTTLIAPFGLEGPVFEAGAVEGTRYEKPALEPDATIQDFLVDLAKQRGMVVNDTTDGALRYWKSIDPGNPVAHFEAGKEPLIKVAPSFNARSYFSELTGFADGKRGKAKNAPSRLPNPHLTGVVRPHCFKLDETESGDVPAAVKAKAGRMFGEVASYTVSEIPTWRDPSGALWQPNTTIKITAPNAMIYRPYEFLIRSVALHRTRDKLWSELNVVLPGSYSGALPDSLPWDG